MLYTPEVQAEINTLRAKVSDGSATLEDMKRAILLLRQDRQSAAAASDGARKKRAKAAIPNATDLLGELDAL